MRAIMLFLLLVAVFCIALVLAWPRCVGPVACTNALARNRPLLIGLIAGATTIVSLVLWRMIRRGPPGPPED